MTAVGIVGGGRMGLWLKREISRLYRAAVYDIDRAKSDVGTLDELVELSDVIIVAVGFKEAGDVVKSLSGLDVCGRLVLDIATFKKYVLPAYASLPDCALAATAHPMFGPGADTIRGRKVVVMEVPGKSGADRARAFFESLGASVVEGSVEEHERFVKYTIGLSYAVGLALARIYAERWPLVEKYGGTSFRYLSVYAFSLLGDAAAPLYAEEAGEAVDEFIKALKEKGKPPAPPVDPDEAYRLFYEALSRLGY
ncbi:Prephenate dehydrogenase [Thermoproteus uzoniensis 768-20]|uniref:Prephenate dehydrogenase n=1 Tax=Thermoproteus uzoniensis (strain 768-20) TaxID=999630 RepID=F2L3L4_THEU7|nr:prephenate dehydrogenase [Thermoproteus uzoniensis]AEA13253.1 Prephenate dehydrogenase [Thermoproteus uzoniensis 768-20]